MQFKAKVNERQARAIVRAHRGRVTDRLPAVKGLAVTLPARQASALRQDKQVRNVTLNTRVHSTKAFGDWLGTTFPRTVGADKAWDRGITGKGVGVAVIDSGINGDMPDFKNADGTSRVTNVIANPGATRPGDEVGHGTHVAGIIAGNSAPGSKKSVYLGIAPEADLIAVKTADDAGNSTVLDVINALQSRAARSRRWRRPPASSTAPTCGSAVPRWPHLSSPAPRHCCCRPVPT